jgi:Prim-pol 4/Herpesviridae UL52/UL70 DNA primase
MSIARWRVPKGPATHVLMDGGILHVPETEVEEFHRAYIEAINSGSKLYVVEQKTDRFKFFVDLDYKAPEKLSDEDLNQFCSIIDEVVGSKCLVARAQVRQVKGEDGQPTLKSGVHLHWPTVVVTRTQALNLRSKIIESLGPGPWDKVVDASVYGGSGLRMLWSHKKPSGDPYVPVVLAYAKTPETLALFSVRHEGNFETKLGVDESLDTSSLQEYVRKYMAGQEQTTVKRVQRHEHDGWYAQTDSKYCENIRREHKSNHIWFTIKSGRISQRCFDEECTEFRGPEHNLPPSIVEQLKDVAIVGSPVGTFLVDILPDGPKCAFQKVRENGPSVLGSGPGKLESFFGQSPRVRTVGFDPN